MFFVNRILPIFFAAFFFVGCVVNPELPPREDFSPPPSMRSLPNPLVAAYLHIGNRKILAENLNLDGIDILNVAFTVINNNHIGLLHQTDAENFMQVRKIKKRYQNMRVLVSVGGYGTAEDFSVMAHNPEHRAVFVDDAVRFVRYFGFDGIDVDWEFPGMTKNERQADKVNFTALLSELRVALNEASNKDGRKYMLTIASGAFDAYLRYIEPEKVVSLVDYFFVMTYDFVGQWNAHTGHHTNIFASNPKPQNVYSIDRIVNNYILSKIPREKLVIGTAFYGRKWIDVDNSNNGLYQKGKGEGSISYKKIMDLLKSDLNYRRFWDGKAHAPYIYNNLNKTFITYDDKQSVKVKVDYVLANNLGGIMFWEYFSDNNGELFDAIRGRMELGRGDEVMLPLPRCMQKRR